MEIIKIDERLLELAKNVTEVELAVVEAEELNDEISDKIARVKRFIELKSSAKQSGRDSSPGGQQVSPTSQESRDHLDIHQHVSEPTSVSDVQLMLVRHIQVQSVIVQLYLSYIV